MPYIYIYIYAKKEILSIKHDMALIILETLKYEGKKYLTCLKDVAY